SALAPHCRNDQSGHSPTGHLTMGGRSYGGSRAAAAPPHPPDLHSQSDRFVRLQRTGGIISVQTGSCTCPGSYLWPATTRSISLANRVGDVGTCGADPK